MDKRDCLSLPRCVRISLGDVKRQAAAHHNFQAGSAERDINIMASLIHITAQIKLISSGAKDTKFTLSTNVKVCPQRL